MQRTRQELNDFLGLVKDRIRLKKYDIIPEQSYPEILEILGIDCAFRTIYYVEVEGSGCMVFYNSIFNAPGLKQCDGCDIIMTSDTFDNSDVFIGSFEHNHIVVATSKSEN